MNGETHAQLHQKFEEIMNDPNRDYGEEVKKLRQKVFKVRSAVRLCRRPGLPLLSDGVAGVIHHLTHARAWRRRSTRRRSASVVSRFRLRARTRTRLRRQAQNFQPAARTAVVCELNRSPSMLDLDREGRNH
jgi:G3E family GTPase